MVIDPQVVAEARKALGRQLAQLRQASGHTQESFAPLTHYGRSTIANVETGRQRVHRQFWLRCDQLLSTGGALATEHDRIELLSRQIRRAGIPAARAAGEPTTAAIGAGLNLPDLASAQPVGTLLAGSAIVDQFATGWYHPEQVLAAPAGRFFAGTTIEARVYPAVDDGRILAAVPHGYGKDQFLQRSRRGLVVGVTDDRAGKRLFGLDNRHARRRLRGRSDVRLIMPHAYILDDLTLGVLWAVANLDEALLNDDRVLAECQQHMTHFEGLPRSAAGRDLAADLAPISAMWLGSDFCARHIQRHIADAEHVPAFWTREQRGEEASTWLLFAHKYEYLRRLAAQFPAAGMVRTFCIPPDTVAASALAERLLVLLSAALMESFDIEVQVAAEPEYTAIDGFVLDGKRRAIVANWVGTDSIWHVDVTTAQPTIREYADATDHARVSSAIAAPEPVHRLRELAAYLHLDWPWLTWRCAQLSGHGLGGIAEPRSRLLSLTGVDRACRYLGEANNANG